MKMFEIFGSKRKSAAEGVSVSEYYEKLGNRTRFAAVACAIVFAVVVMFAASAYNSEINLENLRYMLKFLDPSSSTVKEDDFIGFDYDENNAVFSLGGSIAVCNPVGISVYDSNGERLYNETFRNETPIVKCNGKYVYMCGSGGSELRIYTAYRQYHSESFDYPVTDLSVADTGSFAVATSAKSYRSAVIVYNTYFKSVLTCQYGDKYVSGTVISKDGKYVANALQYSDNGDLIAELVIYDVATGDRTASHIYDDELPLKMHYFSNGYVAMLTDRALRIYGNGGEIISEINVSADTVTGLACGDTTSALYRSVDGLSGGCEVTVYGVSGNSLFKQNLAAEPLDYYADDSNIYMLTHGMLYIYDISGQAADEQIECDATYKQVLCDGSYLMLVAGDGAKVLRAFK